MPTLTALVVALAMVAAVAACGGRRGTARGGGAKGGAVHPVFAAARDQVFLLGDDRAGLIGTAFVARRGAARYVVTNFHVVSDIKDIFVRTDGKATYRGLRVLATDRRNDLALLGAGDIPAAFEGLAASLSYATSQPVFVIGFPDMRSKEDHVNFGAGVISDAEYVAPCYIGEGSEKNIQITVPISPGHSGSPVLNEQGEVLGVVAWGFGPEDDLQAGNYAVPFRFVAALMDEVEARGGKDPAALFPSGGPCADDADCLFTWLCLEGMCRGLKELGEPCRADEDCYLPFACIAGACAKAGGAGAACQGDSQCEEPFYCILGSCRPLSKKGEACAIDIDCESPLYCIAGSCADDLSVGGGPCAKDADCYAPLSCAGGVCRDDVPRQQSHEPSKPDYE